MNDILPLVFVFGLAGAVSAAQDPETVVRHNGQLPIALRKGDVAVWEPRLKPGTETLVKHVTKGTNAMPTSMRLCAAARRALHD